jgi:DNA polymerase
MSRTGASVEKFQDIYDNRISFKKQGDPRADALKIVLNSTYGAMKDVFNPLFDPRSANNVCVFGQLLLTDLIERLESVCDLIQSNTDGLIIKLRGNRDEVVKICKEWEARTGMGLGYEVVDAIWQKDVNNYIFHFADVPENGRKRNKYESKGAYVKKLNNLDYDLAIVNKAVTNYLVYGMKVEDTVYSCQNFRDFQKVVKLSNKYKWVEHEYGNGTIKFDNKAYRVFASLDNRDGRLLKCDGVRNPAKFGSTPDKCFIYNDDLTGVSIPDKLDREWYVDLAKKRLDDFGVM